VVARELKFKTLAPNSMDAVADRDFALDLVYACVTIGVHLSRLAEDIVLWSSAEFGYVDLPDDVATGSSLMPQKKNPDIAELLRGRSGRALGSFTALVTVLKGLPLAYNRDLQEDKVALFSATDNALQCVDAALLLVDSLKFDRQRLKVALSDPSLLATDSAERLVSEGVPFREAHHRVAREVRRRSYRPPWDAARSLQLRRIDVASEARTAAKQALALRDWANSHPPQLTR
jgi:argininosuccinate lyase